ncbi:translational activator of cytochrome c oxidase 1-like [Oppia nitens]|uniref:translational activator of cytochrome c oxidase 1-like n=1 Tax=Oppia nitens TaxID=1686743 RepID=UPI0023DC712D|nr:translational activator of cytochrome c oxidase 1-like [Oppia nitens]
MNKLLTKQLVKAFNHLSISYRCQPLMDTEMIYGSIGRRLPLNTTSKRFAGHSKWKNIQHTKASKDAEKCRTTNRMLMKLKIALRNPGGADPKLNRDFGDVMDMCRRANIQSSTLDKCIKRTLERKSVPLKMEILGPNGALLILDAEADNKNALRYSVKSVLKKFKGFAFADEGRAAFAFEEKGIVRVKDKDTKGESISLERAEEIAIEADAEEVKLCSEDESVLLFVTEPLFCHKTKKYIEDNTNLEVIEAGIEMIPHMRVELPEETFQEVVTAIQELEDLEEINKVFNNVS